MPQCAEVAEYPIVPKKGVRRSRGRETGSDNLAEVIEITRAYGIAPQRSQIEYIVARNELVLRIVEDKHRIAGGFGIDASILVAHGCADQIGSRLCIGMDDAVRILFQTIGHGIA